MARLFERRGQSKDPSGPLPPRPLPLRVSFRQALGAGLKGARIEGVLDLKDCTGVEGSPLPPLELINCDIPADIDLSYARLARLSVVNCRITKIKAHWVHIEGPFCFSDTSGFGPAPDGRGNAIGYIDARGAQIKGDVVGLRARLRTPPSRKPEDIPVGENYYALGFRNCEIAGGVSLAKDFVADGGVDFGDGDVTGEVWLRGAEVSAGEGYAFRAQSTRFGSSLILDEGFKASGEVNLLGARLAGTFQCDHGTFDNRKEDGSAHALVLTSAKVGGDVLFSGVRALGVVTFLNSYITGDFSCDDTILGNSTEDGSGVALSLESVDIGGRLSMSGEKFKAIGRVVLSSAKIADGLQCFDAAFKNRTPDGNGYALTASHCKITGGGAVLAGKNFVASGRVSFEHATIAGDLNCTLATFENYADSFIPVPRQPIAIDALDAEIGGDLLLERGRPTSVICSCGVPASEEI